MTRILEQKVQFTTPWFDVVAKKVAGEEAPYFALRMEDYVSVLAFTLRHELVLVRQYRPAVESYTLELPSGQRERKEDPEECARRELAEECGLMAPKFELLGAVASDSGRHENRLWCFLARGVRPVQGAYVPEAGIECLLVPRRKLPQLIAQGEFDQAQNLAVMMLAVAKHGPAILGLGKRVADSGNSKFQVRNPKQTQTARKPGRPKTRG